MQYEQQFMIGPVPVTVTFNIEPHLYIEYLLEYWASDRANPAAKITSTYNNKIFVSTDPYGRPINGKINQLLGYAKVDGPFGDF